MKFIATMPGENAILKKLTKELREKKIYPDVINYEDGFGVTVWSIDDLGSFSVTHDWPLEEKIRFMELYGHKIGGANDENWEMLRTFIDCFVDDREEENIAYVDENDEEFEKTKFYLDVCGGGWVRMVYYNPDSNADGQLVYDLLSDYVVSEAGNKSMTEDEFWNHLYAESKQNLVDIDTFDFAGSAKDFVEAPCDLIGQNAETMEKLIQWANDSLKKNGGQSDE